MAPPVWILCPKCRQKGGLPMPMAADRRMVYYECDLCGHVWKVPKPGSAFSPDISSASSA
jgi:hypothetical protein